MSKRLIWEVKYYSEASYRDDIYHHNKCTYYNGTFDGTAGAVKSSFITDFKMND